MKKSETKMFQFAEENLQLYHNVGYSTTSGPLTPRSAPVFFNIWAGIAKGTARFNRIGDKITPRGMSLKLWISNKLDRPNVMYRIMIVRIPKSVAGTATSIATVDVWDQTQLGAVGNKMLMKVDNDRGFKCLYDRVINNRAGVSNAGSTALKEFSFYKKLWIRNRKARDIIYDSTTSEQIVNNPIILMVIPYDAFGTQTTDNVASFAYYGTCYYKDV